MQEGMGEASGVETTKVDSKVVTEVPAEAGDSGDAVVVVKDAGELQNNPDTTATPDVAPNVGETTTASSVEVDSEKGEAQFTSFEEYQAAVEALLEELASANLGALPENLNSTSDISEIIHDFYIRSKNLLDVDFEAMGIDILSDDQRELYAELYVKNDELLDAWIDSQKSKLPPELLQAKGWDAVAEQLTNLTSIPEGGRAEFAKNLAKKIQALNTEEDVNITQLFAEAGADVDNEDVQEEIKKTTSILGYIGTGLGIAKIGLDVVWDYGDADFGKLLSFLGNPTYRAGGEYNFARKDSAGNEVVPYYAFQKKFENSTDVGKALAGCSEKLGLENWLNSGDNKSKLAKIKDNGSVSTTIELFQSLYDVALSDKNASAEANWSAFSDIFVSYLFSNGEKNLKMDPDSKDFLKEKLKDQCKGLKKLWKTSGANEETNISQPEKNGQLPESQPQQQQSNTEPISSTATATKPPSN